MSSLGSVDGRYGGTKNASFASDYGPSDGYKGPRDLSILGGLENESCPRGFENPWNENPKFDRPTFGPSSGRSPASGLQASCTNTSNAGQSPFATSSPGGLFRSTTPPQIPSTMRFHLQVPGLFGSSHSSSSTAPSGGGCGKTAGATGYSPIQEATVFPAFRSSYRVDPLRSLLYPSQRI